MNPFLFILLFLSVELNYPRSPQTPVFNLTAFTEVPDDMAGCGDNYYLTERDRKNGKYVCVTDFMTAMIDINDKQILLKYNYKLSDERVYVYSAGNYILSIKNGPEKQIHTEYYLMDAVITIKYRGKVVFSRTLPGDGGC